MASDPATATKPAYRDRYPCAACITGYLDCAAGAVVSLQCCKDCDGHPGRFALGNDAYTQDEYDDMKRRSPDAN